MKKRVLTALVGIPVLILGVFFAPIWLFGVIIAVICGFVAFELMRCAIGQAPKRLYISSILSAVAIAIFGGLDLRMAAIILLFLFFVLSCEMMACFSTPRKISMEMVAISMLAGGVLPMMLSTLLRIAQFETTISIPELLNGNSTLVRITHDGIGARFCRSSSPSGATRAHTSAAVRSAKSSSPRPSPRIRPSPEASAARCAEPRWRFCTASSSARAA